MKNAYERLGCLEFEKQLRDTRTRIRVALDRFIGEPIESKGATGVCHLVSVFGSDVDIGTIWAAIAGQECLTVSGPDLTQRRVSLGKDPRVLRGTVAVAGRSRSVRHLMALSAQMADDTDVGRIILSQGSPEFVLYRISQRWDFRFTRHGRIGFGPPWFKKNVRSRWTAWAIDRSQCPGRRANSCSGSELP
jgi:hypothetical protein